MKKKKLLQTFVSIFALIVIIFVVKDGMSVNKTTEVVDDGIYTVTVVNTLPEMGELTIAVKEGDNYIDSNSNTVEVNAGTKVKAYFKDGANEGYEVICWGLDTSGVLNTVNATGGDDAELYKEEKLVKTISSDTTMFLYAKKEGADVHQIDFYDTAVKGKRNLVGLAFVEDGCSANDKGVIKQTRRGFEQHGYSLSLDNVTENMEVYPMFDSGIGIIWRDYHSLFMHGLLITLLLSVIAVCLAMFFAIIICLLRLSKSKILSGIASIYVEIIRGIPLLLQLLLIYVLLGPTKVSLGGFFTTEVLSCIVTLTINSSAYTSEIFRSGIQAVDKGQMEAGRALGMSEWQVYKKIVIPQGLKNALPSIVNELVAMIKETSLAVSVDASIGELMSVRKNITASTYVNLPPYIIVAIIYFCVTFTLSKCVGLLEKRLNARD